MLSTGTLRNGASSNRPPLAIRSAPVCSQTKTRPSGATAIAVAPVIPVATRAQVKPCGNVIGPAERRVSRYAIKSANSAGEIPAANPDGMSRRIGELTILDLVGPHCVSLPVGVHEHKPRGRFLPGDPAENSAVFGGDRRRPVALDDLTRGLENGLDEQRAIELPANVREIGPDLASLAMNAVAPSTGKAFEIAKERATATGIAVDPGGEPDVFFRRSLTIGPRKRGRANDQSDQRRDDPNTELRSGASIHGKSSCGAKRLATRYSRALPLTYRIYQPRVTTDTSHSDQAENEITRPCPRRRRRE